MRKSWRALFVPILVLAGFYQFFLLIKFLAFQKSEREFEEFLAASKPACAKLGGRMDGSGCTVGGRWVMNPLYEVKNRPYCDQISGKWADAGYCQIDGKMVNAADELERRRSIAGTAGK